METIWFTWAVSTYKVDIKSFIKRIEGSDKDNFVISPATYFSLNLKNDSTKSIWNWELLAWSRNWDESDGNMIARELVEEYLNNIESMLNGDEDFHELWNLELSINWKKLLWLSWFIKTSKEYNFTLPGISYHINSSEYHSQDLAETVLMSFNDILWLIDWDRQQITIQHIESELSSLREKLKYIRGLKKQWVVNKTINRIKNTLSRTTSKFKEDINEIKRVTINNFSYDYWLPIDRKPWIFQNLLRIEKALEKSFERTEHALYLNKTYWVQFRPWALETYIRFLLYIAWKNWINLKDNINDLISLTSTIDIYNWNYRDINIHMVLKTIVYGLISQIISSSDWKNINF